MGHTQVWGSFCKVVDGEVVWGYACCGGKHHDSPQNQNWAAFSKDSKYEARILGAFSEDSSDVILRSGTTRYLGASAACQNEIRVLISFRKRNTGPYFVSETK